MRRFTDYYAGPGYVTVRIDGTFPTLEHFLYASSSAQETYQDLGYRRCGWLYYWICRLIARTRNYKVVVYHKRPSNIRRD